MPKIRRYEDRDFLDYAATLERTTSLGKEAGDDLKARFEKMTDADQTWVAEVEGRGVGFMILTPNDDGSLEIDWLDVHPDFQTHGIGSLLVRRAEEIAKDKGIHELSIHTWISNKKMVNLSIKNGFETFATIKDFYGKGIDALRLKKKTRNHTQ